jgi:hypothetical protein
MIAFGSEVYKLFQFNCAPSAQEYLIGPEDFGLILLPACPGADPQRPHVSSQTPPPPRPETAAVGFPQRRSNPISGCFDDMLKHVPDIERRRGARFKAPRSRDPGRSSLAAHAVGGTANMDLTVAGGALSKSLRGVKDQERLSSPLASRRRNRVFSAKLSAGRARWA